jgi:hypothetical protein
MGRRKVPSHVDDAERYAILERLTEMRFMYHDVTAHRNRRIAHTDVAIVAKADNLDGVPLFIIEQAVEDIATLLNGISLAHSKTAYGMGASYNYEGVVRRMVEIMDRGRDPREDDQGR